MEHSLSVIRWSGIGSKEVELRCSVDGLHQVLLADKHEEMVGKSRATDRVGEDVHEHLPDEGSPVRGKVGLVLVLERTRTSYLDVNL